jgi:hypothetical protein
MMSARNLGAVVARMARCELPVRLTGGNGPWTDLDEPMTDDDLMLAVGVGLGLLAIVRFTQPDAGDSTDQVGQLAAQLELAAGTLLTPQPPIVPPPTPAAFTPGDPPPVLAPAAPTMATANGGDAIDLSAAQIVNAPDIRSWPIVTTIRSIDVVPGNMRLVFDGQNDWPDVVPPGWDGPLQYTVWAFVSIGGVWVGSGFVQMWRGRDGVGDDPSDFNNNWWYSSRWAPMAGHQLAPGEIFGVCVTPGNARDNGGPIPFAGRSQVVTLPASLGTFTFG